MSTIISKSKALQNAVRWIGEGRKENPGARLMDLVNEAAQRFDLSPAESDALFETILAEEKALEKGAGKDTET